MLTSVKNAGGQWSSSTKTAKAMNRVQSRDHLQRAIDADDCPRSQVSNQSQQITYTTTDGRPTQARALVSDQWFPSLYIHVGRRSTVTTGKYHYPRRPRSVTETRGRHHMGYPI